MMEENRPNLWALVLKINDSSQSVDNIFCYKGNKYLIGFSCSYDDINKKNGWYEEQVAPFLDKFDFKNTLQLTEYSYLNTFANGKDTDVKYTNEITGQFEYFGVKLECTVEVFSIPDILELNLYIRQKKSIKDPLIIIGFRDCSLITSNSISTEDCYQSMSSIDIITLKSDDDVIQQIVSDTSSAIHHMGEIIESAAQKYEDMEKEEKPSVQSADKFIFVGLVQDHTQFLIGASDEISKLIVTEESQNESVYDKTDTNPPILVIDNALITKKTRTTNNIDLLEVELECMQPYLVNLQVIVDKNNNSYRLGSVHISDTGYISSRLSKIIKIDIGFETPSYTVTILFDNNMRQLIKNEKFKEFKDYLLKTALDKIYYQNINMNIGYLAFYVLIVKKDSEILSVTNIAKVINTDAPYLYSVPDFDKGYYVCKTYEQYKKDTYYAIDFHQDYTLYIFNEAMLSDLNLTIKFIPSQFVKNEYTVTLSNIHTPDITKFRLGVMDTTKKETASDEIEFLIDNKSKLDNLIYHLVNTPKKDLLDNIKKFDHVKDEDGVLKIPC